VALAALVAGAPLARAQQPESAGVAAQGERPKDMIVTADNAAAVIENLAESWRVEGDGTSTRTMDVKVKIREEAAIASYGHVFISYLAKRQSAELVSLVVQKPDGRRVTLDSAGITPRVFQGAADIYAFVAATELGKETPENRDKSRSGEQVVNMLAQERDRES